MKVIDSIIICSFLAGCVTACRPTYDEVYNLSFRLDEDRVNGWSTVRQSQFRTENKTEDEKPRLVFEPAAGFGNTSNLEVHLISSPLLMLPKSGRNTLEVGFRGLCENQAEASLLTYSFGSELEVLKRDTLWFHDGTESLSLPAGNIRFLSFKLNYVGDEDGTSGQRYSPECLSLKAKGSLINRKKYKGLSYHTVQGGALPAPTRITALGETVHGASKLDAFKAEYIKSSILQDNTSLVIFEMPFLKMLAYNRYVHGYDDVSEADLLKTLQKTSTTVGPEIELMKWIREHNLKSADKVSVLGNDNMIVQGLNELRDLSAYLTKIGVETDCHKEELDRLADCLKSGDIWLVKTPAGLALEQMEKDRDALMEALGEDFDLIKFYLEGILNDPRQEDDCWASPDFYRRDAELAENSRFLIDRYCSGGRTAIVSCHLSHAVFRPSDYPFETTMGGFLKDWYGDEYSCVALTVVKDSVRAFESANTFGETPVTGELQSPSEDCYESFLEGLSDSTFYVDSGQMDEYLFLRLQGSQLNNPFKLLFCPRSQFDGIVHVQ